MDAEAEAAAAPAASRCPFARGLGFLARAVAKPLGHPVSLNSL